MAELQRIDCAGQLSRQIDLTPHTRYLRHKQRDIRGLQRCIHVHLHFDIFLLGSGSVYLYTRQVETRVRQFSRQRREENQAVRRYQMCFERLHFKHILRLTSISLYAVRPFAFIDLRSIAFRPFGFTYLHLRFQSLGAQFIKVHRGMRDNRHQILVT